MTRKANRINLQFILCIALALMIAISLTLVGCKNGGDVNPSVSPSTSTSPSAEDDGVVIKNGDFETLADTDTPDKAFQSTIDEFSKSADGGIANSKANGSSTVGVVDVTSENFATDTDLADAENPGLYSEDVEGSHVMMIFNRTPNAWLVKSGKVTLSPKTYAKITVWVYTNDLQSYMQANYSDQDNVPADDTFGANITVSDRTNSASNKIATTFDDVVIRDINTNNTWKQYTIYVASGDYASTTFYVSLGLGNGTQSMKEDYVKGIAFFDDLKLEYISAAEYAENAANANLANGNLTGNKQVISDEDETMAGKPTAINFKISGASDILSSMQNVVPAQNGEVVAPTDATGIKGLISLEEAKAVDSEAFANFPFASSSQILMIQNAVASSYQVTGDDIILPANSYKAVTVYVKTSAINSGTGANITIITKGAGGVSDPADYVYTTTSDIDTSDTDHSEDINYFWDSWDAYTLLLKNGSSKDLTVAIRLSLGAIDVTTVSSINYTQGWAAFTNGTITDITKEEYAAASTSTTVKKNDLYYGTYKVVSGFDTTPENNFDAYVNEPAVPTNWDALSGNCYGMGGNEAFSAEGVTSGLVNADYWNNYGLSLGVSDWYSSAAGANPLMIYNETATSFGYASASKTLSAKTYYKISIRVKVVGQDAKAYLYLTNYNLTADAPFAVQTFEVPGQETKYLYELSIGDTTGKHLSDTPELVDLGDGWMQLTFFVATGDNATTYRVEVWNGSRDGKDASQGYVFFNGFSATTMTEATYTEARDQYMDFYSITEDSEKVIKYKREKLSTDSTEPKEKIVYLNATEGNAIFVDASDIDVNPVEDEEEDNITSTGSSCQTQFNYTILLWLSSLILAVILIVVLVILILKAIKNRLKKNEKTKLSGNYNKNTRAEAMKKIAEKKAAQAKAAEEARIAAEKAAEEERIAAEKAAEEARIAAEKAAEEERIAAEKAAEEARIAAEKAAEEARIAEEEAAKAAAEAEAAENAVEETAEATDAETPVENAEDKQD